MTNSRSNAAQSRLTTVLIAAGCFAVALVPIRIYTLYYDVPYPVQNGVALVGAAGLFWMVSIIRKRRTK